MSKIKLVRVKKPKAAAKSKKVSVVEKFSAAITRQVSMCRGNLRRRGKGTAKSWLVDGASYGEKMVIVPMIGGVKLWPTSAIPIDTSKRPAGVAELEILATEVEAGRLNNRIYMSLRNAKKGKRKPG